MEKRLYLLLLLGVIFGCSKKEVTPTPTCILVSFDTDSPESGLTSSKYEYDTQGRLIKSTFDETNLQTTYTYLTSKINAIQVNSKTGNTTTFTYDLNSKGLAISMTVTFSNSTSKQKYTYEYDESDFLKKNTYQLIESNNQITSQKVITYSYQDGNLSSLESDDGAKVTYSYYTDNVLNYNVGMAFLGKRSANFVKRVDYISSKSGVYTYSRIDYVNEYSNDGQLVKQTQTRTKASDGTIITVKFSNYQFTCL